MSCPSPSAQLLEDYEPESCALFLFDSSQRFLHAVFESASRAELNICPDYLKKRATQGGEGGSPFPAQMRFRLVHEFEPLHERRFCHLLQYVPKTNTFKQKLNSAQVQQLLSLFDDPNSAPYASKLPYDDNGYTQQGRLPAAQVRT